MKQVFQNLKNGEVSLFEIPTPSVGNNQVLIKTEKSLISLGTEKMLLEFGRGNLISKALQQPDKVKQVIQKIKTDGLKATYESVQNKLDTPLPMGYSNVGVVLEVGSNVTQFKIGDRVASNGPHAEIVCVPENLCALIPDNVSFEEAAFTVVSAIGIQGIRLLDPTMGETIVVVGLGLIGLISVQLLKANGCNVIAYDFDPKKIALAKSFGAKAFQISDGVDSVTNVLHLTQDIGADGVLVTASAKTNQIISDAAKMCRKRGKIVLVGVIGLDISRADFYEKEISFQVSCSYGPGRYENNYEKKNLDYPIGFVRWTEQRNFQAVLNLISSGQLHFKEMIDHIVELDQAPILYSKIGGGNELGLLIQYPQNLEINSRSLTVTHLHAISVNQGSGLGIIGAGNFMKVTLLPIIKKLGGNVISIATSTGGAAVHEAKKWGINEASTDYRTFLTDNRINTVIISTPHNTHTKMALEFLQSGKNVFLEKPLAITKLEYQHFIEEYRKIPNPPLLLLGFNRRFSMLIQKMHELLKNIESPKCFTYTINAGFIPSNHWVQDLDVGGGRLLGEGCHFIDLLRFLADSEITYQNVTYADTSNKDSFTIQLKFKNGSIGTVNYFANGHKDLEKERLEVFADGKILLMNNFKTLKGYGFKNFKKMSLWNQNKGHHEEIKRFLEAINKKSANNLIPIEDIFEVTDCCLKLV